MLNCTDKGAKPCGWTQTAVFDDVVLHPKLQQRVLSVAAATKNTQRNKASPGCCCHLYAVNNCVRIITNETQ